MVPANFQTLYSAHEIARAVAAMGQEVSQWAEEVWRSSHTDILAIPVLRGGIFFFADLVRQVRSSVEVAPARTWAYEPSQNAVQRASVKVNIESVPARGRAVLLIDDICDSGRTLATLSSALREAGATEVRSAVLVWRKTAEQEFSPDWAAFSYPGTEWLVGYGMEDSNRWSNLPDIYVIRQQ